MPGDAPRAGSRNALPRTRRGLRGRGRRGRHGRLALRGRRGRLALRGLAWAVLAWACLVQAQRAVAGRADYVGAEACGRCHAEAYAAWQTSAHARAGELLGASPQGRCLACHTTGEAPAGRPFFASVTCEACHGPGAGYASEDIMRDSHLARALGLRDLSTPEQRAALCRSCHRAATRLAPFDPETAYRRIEHR